LKEFHDLSLKKTEDSAYNRSDETFYLGDLNVYVRCCMNGLYILNMLYFQSKFKLKGVT
jgi:hypothetical protein